MSTAHPAPDAGHAVDAFALAELAKAAKRGLDSGENFLALELASSGLDRSRPDRASDAGETGRLILKLTHIKASTLARTGSYAAARELLRRLPKACQMNPEMAGALARTYKDEAMEFAAGSPIWRRHLQRAHLIYLRGYRLSGSQSFFLGVNAAATAAWLGERTGPDGVDALANSVRPLCAAQLRARAASPEDYWPLATLGELELLQGRDEGALRQYAAARVCRAHGRWARAKLPKVP